jgi:hypothetical protein
MSSPAVPWQRLLTVRFFSFTRTVLSSQPSVQNSTELTTELVAPIVFKITPRHGPRRKHRSLLYAVSEGMCSRRPATGCLTPSIKDPLLTALFLRHRRVSTLTVLFLRHRRAPTLTALFLRHRRASTLTAFFVARALGTPLL